MRSAADLIYNKRRNRIVLDEPAFDGQLPKLGIFWG
jgi:hypothetical protein